MDASQIITVVALIISDLIVTLFVFWAVGRKVDDLHHEVNNKMDRLLTAEKAVSKQEGRDETTTPTS